ncbi:hypothetical protein BDN72DRAFT_963053 [Pluteus cervinus]|uniref:Uncharacterized protein n=1 Tax=Pluteus cervinus TaxID=181527 RepID=A0ACD3AGJ3_9AGAR|nr:hypothetical protein BDN72DRAFT_963053 [Pluteus cervinus]
MSDNIASILPLELWIIIFQMFSTADMITVRSVSKKFRHLSHPFFWRSLTLGSLNHSAEKRARTVIRNPDLGTYIKELVLCPSSWTDTTDTTTRVSTNFWVGSYSRRNILHRFGLRWVTWKHLRSSFRIFRISRKSVKTAINAVPLLPNLLRLTIELEFDMEVRPNPETYRRLWSGLRTEQLRCLDLTLYSGTAVRLLADTIRSVIPESNTSPVPGPSRGGATPRNGHAFGQLEMIALSVATTPEGYPRDDFVKDVRTIMDLGRSSIQSLALFYFFNSSPGDWTQLHLDSFFEGLGVFPRLQHLQYLTIGPDNYKSFNRFLTRHASTLVRLRIVGTWESLAPLTLSNPSSGVNFLQFCHRLS